MWISAIIRQIRIFWESATRISSSRLTNLGFLAALGLLLLVGIFSSRRVTQLSADNGWVIHTHEVLERLATASLRLTSMQSNVRGYVVTNDPKYLGPYLEDGREAQAALDAVRRLTRDNPRQQQRLDRLLPITADLINLLQKEVQARSSSSPQTAEIVRTSGGLETMNRIQDIISEMNQEEIDLLAERNREMGAATRSTVAVLSLGGFLALLIIAFAVWRVNRELLQRQRAREEVQSLNRELQSRANELGEINRELEAFTYSVAHDLRAPLRHVHGFSQILQDEYLGQLSPDAQQCLDEIRKAAKGMGILIDELLKLSRLGRTELDVKRVDLKPIVEKVVRDLSRETENRKIEWRVGALPQVECDAMLIEQVFMNLLSNALKYTRPREIAVIEVMQATSDRGQVFSVSDNGVGFNMKYADKLFGVFQRLHRPDEFEGTGIGLATVQRIIHKHRGKIWAEAEIDKGATFSFTLPGRQDSTAAYSMEA